MKRNEYSFDKIDFNGSRAVIPTGREANRLIGFFFYANKHFLRINMEQSRNK